MAVKRANGWRMAILIAFGTVGGAMGKPGEGIQAGGDVVVRPFAEAAVSYDSNPLLLPKGAELDDWFLDVSPGLSLTRAGELLRMEGLFWGRFRRYDEFVGEDRDDWSEELRLSLGRREDWGLRLHERFSRVSDYEHAVTTMDAAAGADPLSVMERSERVDRDLLDCGIGAGGPLSDKMAVDMLYDHGRIDYQPSELLDSTEHKVSGKLTRKMTDKSSAVLAVEYIGMENDSLSDPADYYAARAGWRWQGTFKSRFEGSVGYADFAADATDAGDTLDRDFFSYNVAWFWQARPKLSMTMGGRSEMQLAPDTARNAKEVNMISGGLQYSATKRLTLSLLVGYRHEDFILDEETDGGVLVQREVEQVHGRLRASYRLTNWLRGYGEVSHEDTQDNVRGDYNQTRATLGTKAEF